MKYTIMGEPRTSAKRSVHVLCISYNYKYAHTHTGDRCPGRPKAASAVQAPARPHDQDMLHVQAAPSGGRLLPQLPCCIAAT